MNDAIVIVEDTDGNIYPIDKSFINEKYETILTDVEVTIDDIVAVIDANLNNANYHSVVGIIGNIKNIINKHINDEKIVFNIINDIYINGVFDF